MLSDIYCRRLHDEKPNQSLWKGKNPYSGPEPSAGKKWTCRRGLQQTASSLPVLGLSLSLPSPHCPAPQSRQPLTSAAQAKVIEPGTSPAPPGAALDQSGSRLNSTRWRICPPNSLLDQSGSRLNSTRWRIRPPNSLLGGV